MKFGYFDDKNKEYVIDKVNTPYPWINYLGNKDYFTLISNTSGGYSFYKDAAKRRITRYRYNNVPIDSEGKYFFINDGEKAWNVGYKPLKTELDSYECRHGLGYTKITSSLNGLVSSQTSFVPNNDQCEIHKINIKNTNDFTKEFNVYSYVEWCFWDALDDMTNFQRNYNIGEVEILDSTIYHKTEYRERRDHYSFYSLTNQSIDGFDTDRESFVGLYNSLETADVIVENKSKNSVASGWSLIGSHNKKIVLEPNAEIDLIFVLGYIENKERKFDDVNVINKDLAKEMIERYNTVDKVQAAFEDLAVYWDNLTSIYTIDSNDEKLNRMVNIWNAYQCMTCFNLSRSASYFESGVGRGMGFRDSNQDILGFVHQAPDRARERLIDLASTQLTNGGAFHQYSPLTKKGNADLGGGFNDDPNWMILAVCAYIKETGDYSILDEVALYESDENKKGTMLEHLVRSFENIANNLGQHGLPLIGRADWNDCLNLNCFSDEPGESFQTVQNKGDGLTAESVFIAGLFVFANKQFSELLKITKNDSQAAIVDEAIAKMSEATLTHGYDGEWFLRAYDANGDKVGSNECEEGKIFIEPQGMCTMAEIGAETGEAAKALDSCIEHLDSEYGMVLNHPAYTKYDLRYGEITSYPGGYKENGGIFCHNNPWVACGETMIGRGDNAFNIYKKIAPAYLEEVSDIHRTEPYVYAQMIAGKEAIRHGEAKNSWLTGTASWNYVTITQFILGIKPDFNGLKIDPCIPTSWDGYKINRIFRGVKYLIDIKNPSHISKGIKEIKINGTAINGNIIKPAYVAGLKVVNVEVVMG